MNGGTDPVVAALEPILRRARDGTLPPHSAGSEAARLNALCAVEQDPVRQVERLADRRLAAAVSLAPRIVVAEALLAGVAVPAGRLDAPWVRLGLEGDVVLDDELALRVVARGMPG